MKLLRALGVVLALLAAWLPGQVDAASLLPNGYLSVSGNQIKSGNNNVRLACVGYLNQGTAGSYSADMTVIRNAGFNCLRIDYWDEELCPGGTCNFSNYLDQWVTAAGNAGLKVVLDHHGNESGGNCIGQQSNGIWYDENGAAPYNITDGTNGCGATGTVTYAQFKSNWLQIANHYKGNSTVIGFDLHNEPLTYGGGVNPQTNWNGHGWNGNTFSAGNGADILAMANDVGQALEQADPGVLIILEGVISYGSLMCPSPYNNSTTNHFNTGGSFDLSCASTYPITSALAGHFLYSVHDYPGDIGGQSPDSGSSNDGTTITQLRNQWWGYLQLNNIAPVWIGEMGASLANPPDNATQLQEEQAWASAVQSYVNGTDANGPKVSGAAQPMSTDWWAYGYGFPQNGPTGICSNSTCSTLYSGQQQIYSTFEYTPTQSCTPSADKTVVQNGSSSSITDSGCNTWTVTGGVVYENGATAGFSQSVTEIAYVSQTIYQENSSNQWFSWTGTTWQSASNPLATGKQPPPMPLTGTVTTQTWASYDQNFSGVTLASGKAFHFNVLPPAQYNATTYAYPLYIWLHPNSEGNAWYSGSNTDPTYLVDNSSVEATSFNTVSFLTNYPAVILVPYADQTTDTCGGCVQNWGGWTNNGSVGSGTNYSGDTGPNVFALLDAIKYVEQNYSIDPTRVYCNGFSLGGIGCEYLMQMYNAYTGNPAVFAAAMSEAGVVEINGYGSGPTTAQENAMTNVPVWWFSGANDTDSNPSHWNEPMFQALSGGSTSYPSSITSASASRAGTSQMHFTLCPSCGHQDNDANGNPVWTNSVMNSWMFSIASGNNSGGGGNAISVSTIGSQTANQPFTVSGTLVGYTSAPTLQYSVNGGAWQSLSGSSQVRNPYNQPGGQNSPWNIPFGNQATWSGASDAQTLAICGPSGQTPPNCVGYINPTNNFGQTFYVGASTDPTFQFSSTNNGRYQAVDGIDTGSTLSATMHVPQGAITPGPYPGDNAFILEDPVNEPNRQYTWGGIQPNGVAAPGLQPGQGPFTASAGEWDDITSDQFGDDADSGLNGYNVGAGLINGCDTNPSCNPFFPKIKHGLRYSIDPSQIKSNAQNSSTNVLNANSWPQRLEDYQSGGNIYTGTALLAGSTLGIPQSTTMPSGLDANCQGLFWTMQNYPLYFRDVAGGGIHLTMDQNAFSSAWGTSVESCFPSLVQYLRVLTNQHQTGQSFTTNPANGPGARVDTGPYPLSSGGGNVTATTFSFTVPGLPPGASNTIAVRDANNTAVTGTSNTFAVQAAGAGVFQNPAQELAYLTGLAGKGSVSGQYVGDSTDATYGLNAIQTIQTKTNFWLGMIEGDYWPGNATGNADTNFNSAAANYWSSGGLVELQLSLPNPTTGGSAADRSSLDAANLLVSGSTTNTNLNNELSQVATALTSLKQSGVVVILRPFYQTNTSFWWWSNGMLTDAQFVSLWQYVHTYLANQGITNVLWDFSVAAPLSANPINSRYPGASYVDLTSLDFFSSTPASFQGDETTMVTTYGKPVGIQWGPGTASAGDTSFAETTLTSALQNTLTSAVWFMQYCDCNGTGVGWGMASTNGASSGNWSTVTTALSNPYIINRGSITPPGGASVTWNPGVASSTITLSNNNLTASSTAASAGGVYATLGYSSGKYCYGAVANTLSNDWTLGLANSNVQLNNGAQLGSTDGNSIGFYPVLPGQTGAIYFNNVVASTGTYTEANGDEIDECVDLNAKLFWVTTPAMRSAGFTWNNSPSADPATGTGGVSISGLNCPCFPTWDTVETPSSATLNAAGPLAVALPTGFSYWQPATVSGGRGPVIINFGMNDNHPPWANDNWLKKLYIPASYRR